MKLAREFYLRSGLEVAHDLIGKQLVHRSPEGVTKGIIVETEAYMGKTDRAAHAFRGRRDGRTAVQYGPGGFVYLFTIYGMHLCTNIVANHAEQPEAVLIRALAPTTGIELMCRRRNRKDVRGLCSGPGKLTQAMGICSAHYGADLCGEELYLETVEDTAPPVSATKRVNIDYSGEAAEYLWRYVWTDSPYLSAPPYH